MAETNRVTFLCPPKLEERITEFADLCGFSKSDFIRTAVMYFFMSVYGGRFFDNVDQQVILDAMSKVGAEYDDIQD